jgi:prephenate dehydrogenase
VPTKEARVGCWVACLGLEGLGGALAARLSAPHVAKCLVWDQDAKTAETHSARHATARAGSLQHCAEADVLLLFLSEERLGPTMKLLQPHLRPGSLVVDLCSGSVAPVQSLGKALAARGVKVLDAALAGGPKAAQAGTLTATVLMLPPQARHTPVC